MSVRFSMPEILSPSCLVLHGGCSVTMHSLANCQHTEVSAQTAGVIRQWRGVKSKAESPGG